MHPLSCTDTHHGVTDLVNFGMAKNIKTWISWKGNMTFLRNKKILNLCLRWHILSSHRFVAEVNFNFSKQPNTANPRNKLVDKIFCNGIIKNP